MSATASPVQDQIAVTTPSVLCDGGGAFGHPAVYLDIDGEGRVVCPYCSRVFVLEANAKPAAH